MAGIYRKIGSYTAPSEKQTGLYRKIGGNTRQITGAEYLGWQEYTYGALLGGFETALEAVGGKVGVVGY